MADPSDEERCIALTQEDERCSRIAKEGRFCFQHDTTSETIDDVDEEPEGVFGVVSSEIDDQIVSASGVKKDIAQNLEDTINSLGDFIGSATSLDLSDSIAALKDTVGKTAPTTGAGAIVGGVIGSPLGPIGVATGMTAGGWFGVYMSTDDDRAVAASRVDEVPSDANVVSSQHEAIRDIEPIQIAISSALEDDEKTEWLRSTLTRERDMDEVSEALEQLPEYHGEDGQRQYYVQDEETEQSLVVIFGIPEQSE